MPILINNHSLVANFVPSAQSSYISRSLVPTLCPAASDGFCYPFITVVTDNSFTFSLQYRLAPRDDTENAHLVLGSDWTAAMSTIAPGAFVSLSNIRIQLPVPNFVPPPPPPPLAVSQTQSLPIQGNSVTPRLPTLSNVPDSTPVPGPSTPSAQSMNSTPPFCPDVSPLSFHFIRELFLPLPGVARTLPYLFATSIAQMHTIMKHHDLVANDEMSLCARRKAFLRHVISGVCASREHRGCCSLSQSFSSPLDMTKTVVDFILSNHLDLPNLEWIVDALDLRTSVVDQDPLQRRRNASFLLKRHIQYISSGPSVPVFAEDIIRSFEKLKRDALRSIATAHRIHYSHTSTVDDLRQSITRHFSDGSCASCNAPGCKAILSRYQDDDTIPSSSDMKISLLSNALKSATLATLRRYLAVHAITFDKSDGLACLRRKLKHYISSLKKGKRSECRKEDKDRARREAYTELTQNRANLRGTWPKVLGQKFKDKLVSLFREETSSKSLASFACASCSAHHRNSTRRELSLVPSDPIFTEVLQHPDFDSLAPEHGFPHPLPSDLRSKLSGAFLDPDGVELDGPNVLLSVCKECCTYLRKNRVPPLSLANRNYLGPVPDVLKDLTVVEEAMIALSRSKCWVVQLKEENQDLHVPNAQRGVKGHIIIYPQRPSAIARMLPPTLDDVMASICVLFVGSSPPSEDWLRDKAKPLLVRKKHVQNALEWLKEHNPLYADIEINTSVLDDLDDDHLPPFPIQHILPSHEVDARTSRYDASDSGQYPETDMPFQNVVVTDVDANAPSHELRAAAVRHIKENGGGYVQVPHDPTPVNEFFNPEMLPMIYPTLFPYGIGGPEDKKRKSALSFQRHIKHLFNLSDRRFQEHYSFLFTAFNIIQRRAILLHTSLKVKKSNFDRVASAFATVSPEVLHIVSERVARGDTATAQNADEQKVLDLMREVKLVTSNVPASSSSKTVMRNEIRALIVEKGLPSFYLTINPADVYSPVVRFLAGQEIDVDNLSEADMSNYWDQSILVAKNPAVAARFFNIYMKAFISAILGFDPQQKNLEGGILGVVNAYYGCVEAQGRGTLHCHMLVWLEGALNPDEIKRRVLEDGDEDFRDRLLAFLDDTISTSIPDDPDPKLDVPSSIHHPASVRGIRHNTPLDKCESAIRKDLRNLSTKSQRHTHSPTCWKYWKGPPHPKECRFDLDEGNTVDVTTFDEETGEITLRCLDGLVNNFNETILRAVRCNMDIKFIGSGAAAKAITYYVTDYITKSQLKAHVAFAALELAAQKLGEYDPDEDDLTVRAKRLLQRCAYTMVSHQELSAQQVVSYLMDFEDHFTSHQYRNLYWTSFEKVVNDDVPIDPGECDDIPTESGCTSNPTDPLDPPQSSILHVVVDDTEDIEDGEDPSADSLEIDVESDEVMIGVDASGSIVQRSSQVGDYLLRGDSLDDLCIWDFVSQIDKVPILKKKKKARSTATDPDSSDSEGFSSDDEFQGEVGDRATEESNSVPLGDVLSDTCRIRPHFSLHCDHSESATHHLQVRQPNRRCVPVPIGPAIPRRDHQDVAVIERYSRLMMILFKPWRQPSDLKPNPEQSWNDVFTEFLQTCEPAHRARMNNMQVLHECKDSRDDHFARRLKSKATFRGTNSRQSGRELVGDDFADEDGDSAAILEHLQSIDTMRSGRSSQNTRDCVNEADRSGMFSASSCEAQAPNDHDKMDVDFDGAMQEVNAHDDLYLEESWKQVYDIRRSKRKQLSSKGKTKANLKQPQPSASTAPLVPIISSGRELRSATKKSKKPQKEKAIEPSIVQGSAIPERKEVDIEDLVKEYTLNKEQARAFRIIAEQSRERNPKTPLRMFLGGPGGTGKSRVINALKEFFERRDQGRRFRLSSFTGVAAKNISGMTLHAALSLSQRTKAGCSGKTKRDLIAMWDGVDYLFIDEVSMIGCKLLLQIHNALVDAKGNTAPFGGINIIFAGDFSQLPPVGQRRLCSSIDQRKGRKNQDDIAGQLLWLSVDTVVVLTEVMRQSGAENEPFVELLGRLRDGCCSDADYRLLLSRTTKHVKPDWAEWTDAPIIVSDNASKDALNGKAAMAFAQRTGRALHWYYATDTRKGSPIDDPSLRDHLRSLDSGRTSHRLGKIPLVIGMPVMITQNYDVEGGIVNGTKGTLKSLRYRVDENGDRHAVSCVVESEDITADSLPSLGAKCAAVLEDTVDLQFVHPFSAKRCRIKRTQLPIAPAFAMTAHKAQGQTLPKVIVDLDSCHGTESPYVMISRVTSLSGLLILRDFPKAKITCRQSEEVRKETKRLERLRIKTIIARGQEGSEEVVQAEATLQALNHKRRGGSDPALNRSRSSPASSISLPQPPPSPVDYGATSNRPRRFIKRPLDPEQDEDPTPHKAKRRRVGG